MGRPKFKVGSDLADPFVLEKESFRPAKVANRMKEELLLLVPDSLSDPRLDKYSSVPITHVECAGDLRNATVSFICFGGEETEAGIEKSAKELEEILNHAAGYLRHLVAEQLGIKHTPLLHFKFDHGHVHATKIESLIKATKAQNAGVSDSEAGEEEAVASTNEDSDS